MLIAISLLITYLIAVIVVGHGVLPMAIVLVIPFIKGNFDSWGILLLMVPWIGIIGLIFATVRFRLFPSKRIRYQFIASIILYLSWLLPAIMGNNESGSLISSFIFSMPFQIAFFIVAGRFLFQMETGNDLFQK